MKNVFLILLFLSPLPGMQTHATAALQPHAAAMQNISARKTQFYWHLYEYGPKC